MLILTQNKEKCINTDYLLSIEHDGTTCLYGVFPNETHVKLGAFRNVERCQEVFYELLAAITCKRDIHHIPKE